ncbi:MAG: hypothetical protein QOI73_2736 [Solirubrobacteraceae bacterium]|nr:hypothetical protein [Solirubrobacteraceae bacterium]
MFSDAQPTSSRRQRSAREPLGDTPSRGGPLTPAQFKQHRRLAERRNVPLRVVLDAVAGRPLPPRSP